MVEQKRQDCGISITQQDAVFGLLQSTYTNLSEASNGIFDVLLSEARAHTSANLAMDLSGVRFRLEAALKAMKNIDDLTVCFPHDKVVRRDGHYVPLEEAQK